MKIASNKTPTPREQMSHADQWRFDDFINSSSERRLFLIEHHLGRICDNIKSERVNQWLPVLKLLAHVPTTSTGQTRVPTMCGRSVLAYLHSDKCVFASLERAKPVIEGLQRAGHPALADSVTWCVAVYILKIAALRETMPITPPSSERKHIALLLLLVPQVDAALSELEQAMVNVLAEIPETETVDG